MTAETIKSLVDAFGPLVAVLIALFWFLRKPDTVKPDPRSSSSAQFHSDDKEFLRTEIRDPILRAVIRPLGDSD